MIIHVKVKPSSGRQEVLDEGDGKFLVSLKSAPENNKANIELIKLLKKYFKGEVKIKSGLKSKNKILEVELNVS